MKILMLNYEFLPLGGGSAPVSYEHARALVDLGHEVDVVTMGFADLPREEVVDGVQIYRVPCMRKRREVCQTSEMASYILSALPFVLKLVRSRQYDINHTHFIIPTGLLSRIIKGLTGLPYVITTHGSDVPGYNPDRFKFEHKLIGPLWRGIINGASEVISPTAYLEDLILSRYAQANVKVIPHGFNYERFKSNGSKKKGILVVTRMLKRKGVQYLLEGLRGLDLKGFHVNVVGDGPYLPTLKEMAEQHNLCVKFWGWLDNRSKKLQELYETSSIFVFPSEAENFPVVLLEAMSSGQAIVTSDSAGCPEVVGDTAIVVPERNPAAIREALSALICDSSLRERLAYDARTRVETEFSWSRIAKEHVALYTDIIGEKVNALNPTSSTR